MLARSLSKPQSSCCWRGLALEIRSDRRIRVAKQQTCSRPAVAAGQIQDGGLTKPKHFGQSSQSTVKNHGMDPHSVQRCGCYSVPARCELAQGALGRLAGQHLSSYLVKLVEPRLPLDCALSRVREHSRFSLNNTTGNKSKYCWRWTQARVCRGHGLVV